MNNEIQTRTGEFTNVDLQDTALQNVCDRDPVCHRRSKYRSPDGSCNNLREPNFGRSFTPLQRIIEPDFADGFMVNCVLSRKH